MSIACTCIKATQWTSLPAAAFNRISEEIAEGKNNVQYYLIY